MATLHLLSASPGSGGVEACLGLVSDGDSLLCFGDGVYHLLGASLHQILKAGLPVFVLAEDAEARGVEPLIPARVERIDYPAWVALSERHERSASWF